MISTTNQNSTEDGSDGNGNTSDCFEVLAMYDIDDQTRHGTYLVPPPYENFNHRPGSRTMETIKIRNGRCKSDLTLDEAAFELVECPTTLATDDFYKLQNGDEELTKQYYHEISEFVKKKLGCDEVVCFNSQVRNGQKANGRFAGGGVTRYATGAAHTDSSPVHSDVMALNFLRARDDTTRYKRYANLNFWRNISDEPIRNYPLVLLDERSTVKPDDYIPKDFVSEEHSVVHWGLSARHADRHKWYYFPGMTKSEGILFKQVDSDFTKTSRTCFHMAVADPSSRDHHPPRESIEVRMFCYWKETEDGLDTMPTYEKIRFDCIRDPRDAMKYPSLHNASFLVLLRALVGSLPILGKLFVHLFIDPLHVLYRNRYVTVGYKIEPYTGDPNDYNKRFLQRIEEIPSQPKFVLDFIRCRLRGRKESEGIRLYTRSLVDDYLDQNGTSALQESEKKEVVACLLQNEQYMKLAKQNLREFL